MYGVGFPCRITLRSQVRKSITSSHPDRRRYELIIEKYLKDCYRQRTAARVSELADLLQTSRPYLSRVIPASPLRTPIARCGDAPGSDELRLLATRGMWTGD